MIRHNGRKDSCGAHPKISPHHGAATGAAAGGGTGATIGAASGGVLGAIIGAATTPPPPRH